MAQRLYLPREQVFSNLGAIGAGYKLYAYETGTVTPKDTYSDTALTVANTNPIVADSAGRLGDIFVSDLNDYKLILKDASDNTIWTADPVDPKVFTLNDFDPRPNSFWGTTTGTASAYTLTADPAITAYSSTQVFSFACHLDCNASPTIAISGLSALNLKKYDNAGAKVALEAGDLQSGQTYEARNDGTDIVILNPRNSVILAGLAQSKTIASGVITIDTIHSNYTIDTESAAASDDLDTINGGVDGEVIIVGIANNSRNVVIKHDTGNIFNPAATNITLDLTSDKLELVYNSSLSKWIVLNLAYRYAFLTEKTANGYTYLPNGLILQWGTTILIGADNIGTVTLPVTYPTSVLNIQATSNTRITGAGNGNAIQAAAISTSQIQVYPSGYDQIIMWQTIGY